MNKKVISLGLAGLILGTSTGTLASTLEFSNHTSLELAQANFKPLDIQSKKLSPKTAGRVDINLPVFKGLTNPSFQNDLNKSIEAQANNKIKDYNQALEASKGLKSNAQESNLLISYEVKANSYLASVIVNTYMIVPGQANGTSSREIYNIDVAENKVLKLDDLFKPATNFKEIIDKSINNEISKNKAKYFTGDQGFKGVNKDTKFYISKVGDLVITYDKYEIAPGSTGVVDFLIPHSEIKHILIRENLVDSIFRSVKMKTRPGQDVAIIIPSLVGLTNKNFEKDFNARIKSKVDKGYEAFEIKAGTKKGLLSSYYVDYQVYLENPSIASFSISSYEYIAEAANGTTNIDYYNLDLKTNKELSLKDLFKDKSNYKAPINREIQSQIDKSKSDYFTGDLAFKSIKDDQKFHLDQAGNLVIAFDQAEIAPASRGLVEFTIQKSLLKDILK